MIFQTSNKKEAARILAAHFRCVLVRCYYRIEKPIRLRADLLNKLEPYVARHDNPATQRQIDQWMRSGGVLLDYRYRRPTEEILYDAHLYCECPFSLYELPYLDTTVVIYRPPSWRSHEKEVSRRQPPAELCRKLRALMGSVGLSPEHAAVCDALGLDTKGISSLTNKEICARLGITPHQLIRVRRYAFPGSGNSAMNNRSQLVVLPIIPRIEPEKKDELLMYRAILKLPELNGARLAVGGVLGNTIKYWTVMIRALARTGSISLMDTIGLYSMNWRVPDYDALKIAHDRAREKLDAVIATVEAAPELTAAALRPFPPVRVPPSVSRARSEAVAHAHGTPD